MSHRHIFQLQSGSASIEFALSISLFFLIFFCLIAFGTLFWFQQKLSYAAGQGSRLAYQELIANKAMVLKTAPWLDDQGSGLICQDSLQHTDYMQAHTRCRVQLHTCTPLNPATPELPLERCNLSVTLRYNTSHNSLIHSANWVIAMFQNNNSASDNKTMPLHLVAQSTVQIQVRAPSQ